MPILARRRYGDGRGLLRVLAVRRARVPARVCGMGNAVARAFDRARFLRGTYRELDTLRAVRVPRGAGRGSVPLEKIVRAVCADRRDRLGDYRAWRGFARCVAPRNVLIRRERLVWNGVEKMDCQSNYDLYRARLELFGQKNFYFQIVEVKNGRDKKPFLPRLWQTAPPRRKGAQGRAL